MATRDEARKLMQQGYGRVMYNLAASYVSPVYWAPAPDGRILPHLNHGTMFFLKCGGAILGITAEHVYAGYLERKNKEPGLISQIGNLRIDLESRLIARDADLDLATFEIHARELERLDKIAHVPPDHLWPPPAPAVDKGVFMCGFPLSGRSFRNPREIDFESVHFGLVVDRMDERTITCQFQRDKWLDMQGNDTQGEQYNMGGMSGAPVWAMIQHRGVESWCLAGIVVQFLDLGELLYARRPNAIKPSGHLEC